MVIAGLLLVFCELIWDSSLCTICRIAMIEVIAYLRLANPTVCFEVYRNIYLIGLIDSLPYRIKSSSSICLPFS